MTKQDKTHFADDETLAYIAKLEAKLARYEQQPVAATVFNDCAFLTKCNLTDGTKLIAKPSKGETT